MAQVSQKRNELSFYTLFSATMMLSLHVHFVFQKFKCRSCICLLTVGQLIQLLDFINITLLLFKE